MKIYAYLIMGLLGCKIDRLLIVLLLVPVSSNSLLAFSGDFAAGKNELIDVTVLALNVGGREQNDLGSDKYLADQYFFGGMATDINYENIEGTEDNILYLSHRFGDFSYSIPLDNGNYDITLLFAELNFNAAGARQFTVEIEKNIVVSGLDLYAEAGFFSAYSLKNNNIAVVDGNLDLKFSSNINNALLSGIRITRKVLATDDDDRDGVINAADLCFYTPEEDIYYVNDQGCSLYELDADKDNVANPYDFCDQTPRTELVDRFGCSLSQKDYDFDGYMNDVDLCDNTPYLERVDSRGCGIYSESEVANSAFVENQGLLVVEMESTVYPSEWQYFSGNYSSGNGYLRWVGGDFFSQPGNGLINIPVQINTPGIYKFLWLNSIEKGRSSTDHNDSWLKIIADSFYGVKNDNHVVCPRDQESTNDCMGDAPMGSSKAGWFKVFRFSGPITQWFWRAKTSDNDGHDIYVRFDTPGEYVIQVSGRSNFHAIDKLVLFRTGNEADNVEEAYAISSEREESSRALTDWRSSLE